jgi:starvation-inducible DNA-binding protein
MAEASDEIAERIRALGFHVEANFGAFKKISKIKDESKVLTIKEMLHSLIEGHEILIRHARTVAELGDRKGDFASVDMLGRRLGTHEKMVWMLRSQLKD